MKNEIECCLEMMELSRISALRKLVSLGLHRSLRPAAMVMVLMWSGMVALERILIMSERMVPL